MTETIEAVEAPKTATGEPLADWAALVLALVALADDLGGISLDELRARYRKITAGDEDGWVVPAILNLSDAGLVTLDGLHIRLTSTGRERATK